MQQITASNHNHTNSFITLCAVLYGGLCLTLAWSSNAYAAVTLPQFGLFLLAAHSIWGIAIYYSRRTTQFSIPAVLFSAIALRLCLLSGFPVLEDDIYRYLWDGYLTATQGSPYGLPPALFFPGSELSPAIQNVLGLVSYPDVVTVYGPLTELLFAAAYFIAPGQVWPIKVIILCFDCTCLLLLARWLSPRKLLLISWCPLLLFQFALNAHIDIIAITLLMAGIHFTLRPSHWWLPPLLFALAVAGKIFALLAIPFLLRQWRQVILFTAMLAAIYFPILVTGHSEFDGLSVMGQQWHFNSLFTLAGHVLLGAEKTRWLSLLLLCGGVMMIYYFYGNSTAIVRRLHGCTFAYLLLLLLLSVLNPWYVAWLLLFAVFTNHSWPWVFAVVVWLSLLTGINLQQAPLGLYEVPGVVIILEYAIVAVALLWSVGRKKPKVNRIPDA